MRRRYPPNGRFVPIQAAFERLPLEAAQADIAVFNPETVRDNSTYDDVNHYATGVEYVLVNGKISIDAGEFHGALNGKVLLKPKR